MTHVITHSDYRLADLRGILEEHPRLENGEDVRAGIRACEEFVAARASEDEHIYGVNTGLGALCETRIGPSEVEKLQRNLILSHAAGVGDYVDPGVARATLFLKLLTFRGGFTGVTMSTVDRLVALWNHDIVPAFPKKGTLGASGDLAPLAHMALPLLGLGQAYHARELISGAAVLEKMNWEPTILRPKEGLALVNGVQYISAVAACCLLDIEELIAAADVIASMSAQAFSCSRTFYDERYHATSRHADRQDVAKNLRRLLNGSNHHELPTRNKSMQDPYSFRCIPQVHGAVRQTFSFARQTVEQECNGTSDNPLFFPDSDAILFGGNLHGESIALVLDFLAIAVTELSSISECRTYQLLSGERGLPEFLVPDAGVNSGLMIAQYTAAALLNECKVFSTPASVDTIPTSQLQEDHVSMGGTAAHKLEQIVDNCEHILAIELLAAVQAAELNAPLQMSPATVEVMSGLRRTVDFLDEDRLMSDDIHAAFAYVRAQRGAWHRASLAH